MLIGALSAAITDDIHHMISINCGVAAMPDTGTAKLFKHGRSQAVRLPKEFRMPGSEVRVRRIGRAVLLEPIEAEFDVDAWFAKIDEYLDEPFMADGRQQPAMPPERKLFDE